MKNDLKQGQVCKASAMWPVWLQVHIKGRMPAENAEKFCEELRRSRRRTCSMAIVRSAAHMDLDPGQSQSH